MEVAITGLKSRSPTYNVCFIGIAFNIVAVLVMHRASSSGYCNHGELR